MYTRIYQNITSEVSTLEDKHNIILEELHNEDISSNDIKCTKLINDFLGMPNPNGGGNMTGRAGHGFARITRVR